MAEAIDGPDRRELMNSKAHKEQTSWTTPLLMVVALLLSGHTYADAEGIPLGEFEASTYNQVLDRQVPVKLDMSTTTKDAKRVGKIGEIMLCSDELIASACFNLNPKKRAEIRSFLSKFFEWKKKADEKGDSFEKRIGNLSLGEAQFLMNHEWYFQLERYTIQASFFSKRAHDYQFVLTFPKITASRNEYITHVPATLYFGPDQAEAVQKALSEEALALKIKAYYEKGKKLSDEYK